MLESLKTDPIEWHRRNRAALKRVRLRVSLRVYDLLEKHEEEICEGISRRIRGHDPRAGAWHDPAELPGGEPGPPELACPPRAPEPDERGQDARAEPLHGLLRGPGGAALRPTSGGAAPASFDWPMAPSLPGVTSRRSNRARALQLDGDDVQLLVADVFRGVRPKRDGPYRRSLFRPRGQGTRVEKHVPTGVVPNDVAPAQDVQDTRPWMGVHGRSLARASQKVERDICRAPTEDAELSAKACDAKAISSQ